MIEARGLTKRYGRVLAVDALSFDVRPGVVTGFLGPNGSGKTTTIRLLLGLITPTAGTAEIFGLDCQRRTPERLQPRESRQRRVDPRGRAVPRWPRTRARRPPAGGGRMVLSTRCLGLELANPLVASASSLSN